MKDATNTTSENFKSIQDGEELFDASGYTPTVDKSTSSVTANEDDVVSEKELKMYTGLTELVTNFAKENGFETSIGKMSKGSTRRIVVSMTEQVEELPEGCTTAGFNSFKAADTKMKAEEKADGVEVLGLTGRGITLGESLPYFTSVRPKSRTKKLTTAMIVGGKPNGTANKLTIKVDGEDKEKPMSVDKWLALKADPLTPAHLAVANGDARWRMDVVKDEDGNPVLDEDGNPVEKRVCVTVMKGGSVR